MENNIASGHNTIMKYEENTHLTHKMLCKYSICLVQLTLYSHKYQKCYFSRLKEANITGTMMVKSKPKD